MKDGTRNLLIGVFVIGAMGALAIMMVLFGETPDWLFRSEWTLRITGVRDLRGIGDGSPVKLNGVEIGRVRHLDLKDHDRPDRGTIVFARIKNQYSIPAAAMAKVYGATFGLGSGHVDIVVEPAEPDTEIAMIPREGGVIRGEMASMIGEVITKDLVSSVERTITNFGNFAASAEPVAKNLGSMLEERSIAAVSGPNAKAKGLIPNVTTVIERLDNLVANLNTVLGDRNVQEDVKDVVRDLKGASEELKATFELWNTESRKVADNLNGGIDRTEENLERSFRKLNQTLEDLDSAAKSMAEVLHAVADGKGTAGMLVRDERLYEAAVLSLERLSGVMQNLLVITGKIKEDGYIIVGQAPSGVLRKRVPIPLGVSQEVSQASEPR